MKNFSILFTIFLFLSCNDASKRKIKVSGTSPQKTDSTSYYDSIYEPYRKNIELYFSNLKNWGHFNGVVLYAENGHIITNKAYGYSTFKPKVELNKNQTFQLASASKPFTSTAIMQLVEQGKLSLQDSVKKYIQPFPYKDITIEMLLTHLSGIGQYTHFCDNPAHVWPNKDSTIHNEDVIEIMNELKPVKSKRKRVHYYSNTNYILLAQIIETVSGMSYEEYMSRYIFTPSNMFDTRVYNRENQDELCEPAQGYANKRIPEGDTYLNGCIGDKGIYSNTMDLFRFHEALQNELLLTKQSMEEAFYPRVIAQAHDQKYGYGWRVIEDKNANIVFHTGWWNGFKTYFIRIPDKNQVAIILSNTATTSLSVRDLAAMLP